MIRHFTVFVALLGLVQTGCNRDPLPGSDEGQPTPDLPGDGDPGDGDPGDGDPGDGDPGDGDPGDGDPGCAANEIECEGICTNPMSDTNNCGECGRTCMGEQGDLLVGGCFQGECRPLYSECISEAEGLATCGDICESYGESCRDDDDILRCGKVAYGWYADDLEGCQAHFAGVGLGFIETCEDTLPFGDDAFEYIRCCCTQTAQLP
jgi:hypothetical protein